MMKYEGGALEKNLVLEGEDQPMPRPACWCFLDGGLLRRLPLRQQLPPPLPLQLQLSWWRLCYFQGPKPSIGKCFRQPNN